MPWLAVDRAAILTGRLLRRSPLALTGWILVQAFPGSGTWALTPTAIATSSTAPEIWQSPALMPLRVTAEPVTLPPAAQFSQPAFSTRVSQAVIPAADGTGTVVTQTGNTFEVTGGTLAGENLFHSFEQFGLSADQAATILSNPDIANILGRVVGGDASFINGLLQVTGGNSNLFLINPAGIIFGPDANIIMPAAFTATTAHAIEIGDFWFEAIGTSDYANLTGNPTGFVFTSDNPGIVINAGNLVAAPNTAVTLLGGFVLNTGTIETAGGKINIATVPGENLVRITPEGSLLSLELPLDTPDAPTDLDVLTINDLPTLLTGEVTPAELGVIVEDDTVRLVTTKTELPIDSGTTIVAGSLDTADNSFEGMGGEIDVLGDRVGLIDATLDASGTHGGGTIQIGGAYQGSGDIPNADVTYIDSNSTINADALENGNGGTVIAWADNTAQFFGNISARGGSDSGDGGFVEVSGQENLGFNGTVDVSAANGASGSLLLDPKDITIVASDGGNDDAVADGEILAADGGTDSKFTISWDALKDLTGDINLVAKNDITVEDGLSLIFENSPDSITFTANSDQENGGKFVMDKTKSIDTDGASLAIFGNEIVAGDIEATDISLVSKGDIVVNTITSNGFVGDLDQGITINAEGQFRALGTSMNETVEVFSGNFEEGIPQYIEDSLSQEFGELSQKYERVDITFQYSVAIIGIDNDLDPDDASPTISIRYGDPENRQLIFPKGNPDAPVTIQGDPDEYFALGPQDIEVTAQDGTDPDDNPILLVKVEGSPLAYGSDSSLFPENVSGLVSGIALVKQNGSLTSSLQNQTFGELPETHNNGNGNNGNGSGNGGNGGGSNNGIGGGNGGGDGNSGGNADGGGDSLPPPPETQRLDTASENLCEDAAISSNASNSDILDIDESLITQLNLDRNEDFNDPCLHSQSSDRTAPTLVTPSTQEPTSNQPVTNRLSSSSRLIPDVNQVELINLDVSLLNEWVDDPNETRL